MSASFKPGEVVVCIDARTRPANPRLSVQSLRQNAIYRIADAQCSAGHLHLSLQELPLIDGEPQFWAACRFRKIDDEQIPEVLERLKSIGKPKVKMLDPSRHSREMA